MVSEPDAGQVSAIRAYIIVLDVALVAACVVAYFIAIGRLSPKVLAGYLFIDIVVIHYYQITTNEQRSS